MITVREFLETTRAPHWHECHWSLAGTIEQATAWFAKRNITGKIYRVAYGWWCVPAQSKASDLIGRITGEQR